MSFVIGVTENGKSWIASDGKSINQSTGEINNDVKKVMNVNDILIGYTGTKEMCECFIHLLTHDDWASARTVYNALSNFIKTVNTGKLNSNINRACFLIIGKDDGKVRHFLISSSTNQFIIKDCVDRIHTSYLYSNNKFEDKYDSCVKRALNRKFKSEYYLVKSLLTHISKFDDSVNDTPFIEFLNPK